MQNPLDADASALASEKAIPPSPLSSSPAGLAGLAGLWQQLHLGKIALFMVSLLLFVLAVILMKEGARPLAPVMRGLPLLDNPASALGFGWLFAYVIMSGSPVAAAALTFFDAGVTGPLGAFAMIIGSRLGASFIVLFIGFIYVLRGRDRATSLSMGLISLTITATTYAGAFLLGIYLLQSGSLNQIQLGSGLLVNSIIDQIFNPIANLFITLLPNWLLFVVGLAIIMVSFNLFDRCLPQMAVKESQVGRVSRMVYRPWVMFTLGAAVTLISMAVSVSLSILVPLSARGFIRRENVIPYIMGANITTFVDTLLASLLLNNPLAFTIILTGMASITMVSMAVLATIYRPYERAMLQFVAWVVASNRNLALFMIAIFVVPLILMLF